MQQQDTRQGNNPSVLSWCRAQISIVGTVALRLNYFFKNALQNEKMW